MTMYSFKSGDGPRKNYFSKNQYDFEFFTFTEQEEEFVSNLHKLSTEKFLEAIQPLIDFHNSEEGFFDDILKVRRNSNSPDKYIMSINVGSIRSAEKQKIDEFLKNNPADNQSHWLLSAFEKKEENKEQDLKWEFYNGLFAKRRKIDTDKRNNFLLYSKQCAKELLEKEVKFNGLITIIDILIIIFRFLPLLELYKITGVCRFWRKICHGVNPEFPAVITKLDFKKMEKFFRISLFAPEDVKNRSISKYSKFYKRVLSKFGNRLTEINCSWCIYLPIDALELTPHLCPRLKIINFEKCSLSKEFFENLGKICHDIEECYFIDSVVNPQFFFANTPKLRILHFISEKSTIAITNETIETLAITCEKLEQIYFNEISHKIDDRVWAKLIQNNRNTLHKIRLLYDERTADSFYKIQKQKLDKTVEEMLKLKNITELQIDEDVVSESQRNSLREKFPKCKIKNFRKDY